MNREMEERLSNANDLREKELFGESIKEYTNCLLELIQIDDAEGLIHCLSGQSLIYKILARKNNSLIYRHLTLSFAREALYIAERNLGNLNGQVISIAYSSYGDALLMDSQIKEALLYFEKALVVSTAEVPEKGRLKAHVGGIKYLLGEKQEGQDLILESLSDIRLGDMNAYNIRVWETGALNALSKIYALENNSEKALETIKLSLDIATSHDLSIRKRETEEILAKISSGQTDFSL